MPRKGPAPKRPIDIDPVYGSQVVTQLVNKILMDGKKQVAQRIVYTALEGCREKTGTDPVLTLKRALDNVRPAVGRAPDERDPRRLQRPWCRGEEARGHPQDGRVQPRLRSLPLVMSRGCVRLVRAPAPPPPIST